jgi:hypothetical protein
VVADLARADPRIRLVRQPVNGGPYVARNRGLAEATGAFVTTHDTDDWSHPQKIETQLAWLAENPRVAGVCTHWVRVLPDLAMSPNWRIGDRLLHWNHSSFLFRREVTDTLGPWDPIRVGADTELIWRIQAAHGEWAVKMIAREAPLAFALDEESSLTRAKATHVRTVYFGLRQIYRAVALASHAGGLPPAEAAAARARATPPELFGQDAPPELDFLLMGDGTDPEVAEAMRAFADGEGRGARLGIFHWPDLARDRARLAPAYCALLERDEVRAILPTARVVLPRRFGIFFGSCHPEIDRFPEVVTELAAQPGTGPC